MVSCSPPVHISGSNPPRAFQNMALGEHIRAMSSTVGIPGSPRGRKINSRIFIIGTPFCPKRFLISKELDLCGI